VSSPLHGTNYSFSFIFSFDIVKYCYGLNTETKPFRRVYAIFNLKLKLEKNSNRVEILVLLLFMFAEI